MTFYLYLRGSGEGCDYTVGCNQSLVALTAKTVAGATNEAFGILSQDYDFEASDDSDGGHHIESAMLLEKKSTLDLEGPRQAYQDQKDADARAAAEAEERALLARLKAKFES